AALAVEIGQAEAAARLLGAVDAFLERTGARLLPFDVPGYQKAEAGTRTRLAPDAFAAAHLQGRGLTPDEWVAEADGIVTAIDKKRQAKQPGREAIHGGLTAR